MQSDKIDIQQETHELHVTFFKKTIDILEGLHKDQLKLFKSLVEKELDKTSENITNILQTLKTNDKDLK